MPGENPRASFQLSDWLFDMPMQPWYMQLDVLLAVQSNARRAPCMLSAW